MILLSTNKMYQRQIKKINEDIDRTGRAIIGLGCSFVQGQGAFDEEIVKKYGTTFTEIGDPLRLNDISDQEKNDLVKKYPILEFGGSKEIIFTFMEYQNAFTNVLSEKYFDGDYAAINLGQRGCGNRATIKELYLYPDIHWNKLKEIIVVYCPSGLERFDFINDQYNDHHHWVCMWPHDGKEKPRGNLWQGYKHALHSDKFQVLEQICHAQELLTWCKLHNAKLVITPAFDVNYNKEYFYNAVATKITRTIDGSVANSEQVGFFKKLVSNSDYQKIVDLFPWDNMFMPDKMPTFADMSLKQEFNYTDYSKDYFWNYLGKGTPNNWITPCAHPSAKAHDHFAKLLHEHLTK